MAELGQDFTPENELEEKLLALCRHEIEFGLFVQILLNGKVAMALDTPLDQDQLIKGGFSPMTVISPKGYTCLAAFTSPSRFRVWQKQAPQYQYALVTETRWFLRGAKPTMGFALNPGWPYRLEMPPESLARLMRDFGVADAPR